MAVIVKNNATGKAYNLTDEQWGKLTPRARKIFTVIEITAPAKTEPAAQTVKNIAPRAPRPATGDKQEGSQKPAKQDRPARKRRDSKK